MAVGAVSEAASHGLPLQEVPGAFARRVAQLHVEELAIFMLRRNLHVLQQTLDEFRVSSITFTLNIFPHGPRRPHTDARAARRPLPTHALQANPT